MPVARALLLVALGASCTKPAAPPAAPASPFAAADEPALVTAAAQRLPIGRWADFNVGNYIWVTRLKPDQKFKVSGRWDDPSRRVKLDLWTVNLESDGEWDEADPKQMLAVDAGADATASGILALTPGANAGRIRLSRNGSGLGQLSLRIDPIP